MTRTDPDKKKDPSTQLGKLTNSQHTIEEITMYIFTTQNDQLTSPQITLNEQQHKNNTN